MAGSLTLFRKQPFKALYTLYAIAHFLASLPFWVLLSMFRRLRQHPAYSFRQALMIRIVKVAIGHCSVIELNIPLSLQPGREKTQWVTLTPFDDSVYKGVLDTGGVRPAKIGGTWYPRKPDDSELSAASSGDIVLHLHGGAYVVGDGRKDDAGHGMHALLRHGNVSYIFAPQYRLSCSPSDTPFPGALQDTVTSYLYLTRTLGIAPERIILSGDSAGGNLALALMRYIEEFGRDINGLGPPAVAWLWSPWAKPRFAQDKKRLLANPNYGSDYLHYSLGRWGSVKYHGNIAPGTPADFYINHLSPTPPLKTSAPMYLWAGKLELLHDDIVKLAEELKGAGNNVYLDIDPVAPHDVLLMGGRLFFQEAANKGVKNAAEWFRSVRKA